MCGRYAMAMDANELKGILEKNHFSIKKVENADRAKTGLNVAPKNVSMVYRQCPESKDPVLSAMSWTLQPSFAKKPLGFSSFNTRSDSLDPLKPIWRSAKYRRGILFMQGYYEWQKDAKTKERIPFYISHPKEPLLCCLVIWDENPTLNDLPTYSIVTTAAPPELKSVHERQPVIAPNFETARSWVTDEWSDALKLLRANPSLTYYRVSTDVNKVGVEKPGLNKPIKEKRASDFFKPAPKRAKVETS